MIENPETGALEAFNFDQLQENVPELKRFNYRISSYQFTPPIDSSDMEPALWSKLVKIIHYNYDNFDGFVILHGTDTMADLKKKSFGFTDPDSTSGYFYPRLMMKQNGIDPKNELGKVYMLKKHSKIIDAILEKSIDAGALYDGAYMILPKEKKEQIRILATSKEIPYDAMIASNKLDKAFIAKIRTLLLNFHATKHFPLSIAGFEEKPLSLYDQLNHLE